MNGNTEQEDPGVQAGLVMTCVISIHFIIEFWRLVASDPWPNRFQAMQKRTYVFFVLASVFELVGVALYLTSETSRRALSEQATDCIACIALVAALAVIIVAVPSSLFLRRMAAVWLTISLGLIANVFFISESFLRAISIDPIGIEAVSNFRDFVVVLVASDLLISLASIFLCICGVFAHLDHRKQ